MYDNETGIVDIIRLSDLESNTLQRKKKQFHANLPPITQTTSNDRDG